MFPVDVFVNIDGKHDRMIFVTALETALFF